MNIFFSAAMNTIQANAIDRAVINLAVISFLSFGVRLCETTIIRKSPTFLAVEIIGKYRGWRAERLQRK